MVFELKKGSDPLVVHEHVLIYEGDEGVRVLLGDVRGGSHPKDECLY